MLEFLRGKVSDRKLRLYASACFSEYCSTLTVGKEEVINLTERVADGLATSKDIQRMFFLLGDVEQGLGGVYYGNLCEREPFSLATYATYFSTPFTADSLRCIFGNPFPKGVSPQLHWLRVTASRVMKLLAASPSRPVSTKPEVFVPASVLIRSWLTSTVLALANGIYEEKAFDRMPILADALQDAGCDNEEILNHCRGESVHVRGCWVVDSLTGRT